MSGSLIVSLVVALIVSFIVIFMAGGALLPDFAATRLGQVVLALIAAVVGIAIGRAVHGRFITAR